MLYSITLDNLEKESKKKGIIIICEKVSAWLSANETFKDMLRIGNVIKQQQTFNYLGNLETDNRICDIKVQYRIGTAKDDFFPYINRR